MADQNQNPLLPTLDEDEQFMSSENFSNAESSLDWDALLTRGNSNNSQAAMSKWERDSLYVKFDPLVASRKDPADRTSFVFKAPRPPEPLPPQNKNNALHPLSEKMENATNNVNCTKTHSSPEQIMGAPSTPSESAEDSSSPTMKGEKRPTTPQQCIGNNSDKITDSSSPNIVKSPSTPQQSIRNISSSLEGVEDCLSPPKNAKSPSTPQQCIGRPSSSLESVGDLSSPAKNAKSPSTPQHCIGNSSGCPENVENSLTPSKNSKSPSTTPQKIIGNPSDSCPQSVEDSLSPPKNVKSPSTQQQFIGNLASSPESVGDYSSPAASAKSPSTPQQFIGNPASSPESFGDYSSPAASSKSPSTPQQLVGNPASSPESVGNSSSTPQIVISPSTPQQFIGNRSPKSVVKVSSSPLPEISQSQQSAAEIFEENKKHKLRQLSKMELQLRENMEVYVKQKERYNKAVQERDATMLERNEAQRELTNAESRFADMLMLYEQLKNVTTTVEKNCVILKKREEILVDTLQKRETREKAAVDMYTDVMERIKQDFGNKIKEKENENLKLKAKIRMCEMKTTKLEGEISQVDRESESLRKLCEDLMKS